MSKEEIVKKLQELETVIGGFAGYYMMHNYKRERDGKRKSIVNSAKADAYGYCADQLKALLKEINEGA